jgi:hypothetical protein
VRAPVAALNIAAASHGDCRQDRSPTAPEPAMTVPSFDLSGLRPERVRDNDEMFLLATSASFVESGSDTYTGNLVAHFAGDDEVTEWLRDRWEPEELSHGRMLRAYVERAWPELDWEAAYADFFADYARLCTLQALEPTRGQEMAARCVVEMGTTVYYTALHGGCDEPVLRSLAWRIRSDEVNHYKHFYAFFQKYRERERLGRGRVMASLARRALELRREDATIALRHATAWRRRSRRAAAAGDSLDAMAQRAIDIVNRHIPMDLAVRMLLKPLQLRPRVQRAVAPPLESLGRGLILR